MAVFDVVAAKNTGAARNGIITVAGEEVSKTVGTYIVNFDFYTV